MGTTEERFERIKQQESVSKEDIKWLLELAQRADRYEKIISAIANIDTIFYNSDGTERPWNDQEAMTVIQEMAMPVWNEVCQRHRKELIELMD